MTTNQISRVAKLLCLELGEDFKVKGLSNSACFHFCEKGLAINEPVNNINVNSILHGLLTGELEVIKIPWQPKQGELYYSFEVIYGKWFVCAYYWESLPREIALLNQGWVFKTVQEAKSVLVDVSKDYGIETLRDTTK